MLTFFLIQFFDFQFLICFLAYFSCRFGERCRYLHVTQQQPKASFFGTQIGSNQQQKPNAFGFGAQTVSYQQQKPNPFGFGVQNSSQSKGATDFGSKLNQSKVLSLYKLYLCQKNSVICTTLMSKELFLSLTLNMRTPLPFTKCWMKNWFSTSISNVVLSSHHSRL